MANLTHQAKEPLILHAHASGPNPIKIAIGLELLSIPYTVKMWNFGDDPQTGVKGSSFLKINENGRVPALEDPNTGVISWESGACMNYLRRRYDGEGKVLGPRSSKGGAPELQDVVDYDKWEYFLLTTLGPMTGQTNWYRYVCCFSYVPLRDVDCDEVELQRFFETSGASSSDDGGREVYR